MMKETNNNDLLTVKENEIIRLATPLKIVNYKAYDLDDNLIDCIETFSNLRYIVEPKKGIFSDDEILKYAANSKAAAKVRVKRGIADMYDFNLLYNKVPWKLALYYTLLISFASPIFIVGNIMYNSFDIFRSPEIKCLTILKPAHMVTIKQSMPLYLDRKSVV